MSDNLIKFDARKVSNGRLNDQLTAHEEAIKAVTTNEQITRGRIDRLEAMFEGLIKHLGLAPVPEDKPEQPEGQVLPFTQADGVPDDGIVIPEGADRAGHWHAGCVHGFEWGNNCRCIPKTIEYPNVACPRFCEGVERRITHA